MNEVLQKLVKKELCPNDVWRLSYAVKSILRHQISKLPRGQVSKMDRRYPTDPVSMRAFLEAFFARHYLQVQNSLIQYMISDSFLNIVRGGSLRLLDIGSGPAVASLAVTDMLGCIVEYLKGLGEFPKGGAVNVTYVINDTSWMCLGTGQSMLENYFLIGRRPGARIIHKHTIRIQRPFPENLNQIRRIAHNFGRFDMAIFSYVVVPLDQESGLDNLVTGLMDTELLCDREGRMVILQDRFNASRMRRIGRKLGVSVQKEKSLQQLYPRSATWPTYVYSYYSSVFPPRLSRSLGQCVVA
jgi:hypothetical protein